MLKDACFPWNPFGTVRHIFVFVKYYTKANFQWASQLPFSRNSFIHSQFYGLTSLSQEWKQSLLIGAKRVLKSQGTCQNIQSVTQNLANLFLPTIPFPPKSPPLQEESRTELEGGSGGMRNPQLGFPAAGWEASPSPLLLGINSMNTQLPSPHRTREATAPPPDHRLFSMDPVGTSLVSTISPRLHMQTQGCMGFWWTICACKTNQF